MTELAYSSFLDCGAPWAENEFLSGRGELGETSDGEIFMIEVGVFPQDLVGLESEFVRA